jgi:predicted 3-demethylubiquinone-9 3-methyltransferase (glyoxalase superfamily)
MAMPKISPFLWFDTQAEDAAELYTRVFPNSKITNVKRYGPAGPGPEGTAMTVQFQLDGQEFTALNGGPEHFTFNESVSFVVGCKDQADVDHYWEALTSDGGEPGPCGWLKDKYGLSWQIVPAALNELLSDPDPGRSGRAMEAMLKMTKIDIAELRAAADNA